MFEHRVTRFDLKPGGDILVTFILLLVRSVLLASGDIIMYNNILVGDVNHLD